MVERGGDIVSILKYKTTESVVWEETSCMWRAKSDLQSQVTVSHSLLVTAAWNMRAKGPLLGLQGYKYRPNKKKIFFSHSIFLTCRISGPGGHLIK